MGTRAAPLTAAEFFARKLAGFSKTDAQHATKLAYSTIHDAGRANCESTPETLRSLQEWSESAIAEHGVYISAAKSLGLSEPSSNGSHP